jgi:NSS family neurotransmitter:Na+ symporter
MRYKMTDKLSKNVAKQGRETFSSGLAVFFATLGSAVGLGNIWKFPYLTGQNGGGAFILVYLISVVLVGVPIMIAEFYLGKTTRANAVGVFKRLKASKFWRIIGYMGMMSALLIMFFYSSVAGWVYSYVLKAIRGDFRVLSKMPFDAAGKAVEAQFGSTVGGTFAPFAWQAAAVAVVTIILVAGVKKGIERVTKTLMPVLLILIVIIAARSLTLEGAGKGLDFLMGVDFSKISPSVILTALGLSFFKLSLGMGTMITYGSYFNEENKIVNTAFKVAVSDTMVSLLAGLAVFPVVFTFGLEPGGGPGLLFNTIPLVFSLIPFGNVLLVLFFSLAAIAATTAMISMVEVPVIVLTEELGISRRTAVLSISAVILAIGALTVHPESLFGSSMIYGKSFFDFFDYLSSNIFLPVGGLLIAIFVGWKVKTKDIGLSFGGGSYEGDSRLAPVYHILLKFVTPVLLLLVFLNAVGVISI